MTEHWKEIPSYYEKDIYVHTFVSASAYFAPATPSTSVNLTLSTWLGRWGIHEWSKGIQQIDSKTLWQCIEREHPLYGRGARLLTFIWFGIYPSIYEFPRSLVRLNFISTWKLKDLSLRRWVLLVCNTHLSISGRKQTIFIASKILFNHLHLLVVGKLYKDIGGKKFKVILPRIL